MGISDRSDQIRNRDERRAPHLSCGQTSSHSDRIRSDGRWGRSSGNCSACWMGPIRPRRSTPSSCRHRVMRSRLLTRLMESPCSSMDVSASSPTASIRQHWFDVVQDQDIGASRPCGAPLSATGHRLPLRSLAAALVCRIDRAVAVGLDSCPKPAAVFLTHDHDDHVDPRTLLHLPKDTPIIVPSRRNRKSISFTTIPRCLRELGFDRVDRAGPWGNLAVRRRHRRVRPVLWRRSLRLGDAQELLSDFGSRAQCAGPCGQRPDERRTIAL